MISCVCTTHGRPWLLEEAIECYLRQDYQGESELLIYNDCPEQILVCDNPGVRIVNLTEPFNNLTDKLQAAVQESRGKYIACWDDDDISLPWRLTYSMEQMGDAVGIRTSTTWWYNFGLKAPITNFFFGSSLYLREAYLNTPGYRNEAADVDAWDRLKKYGHVIDHKPTLQDMYWIYRWGGLGIIHASGVSGTNEHQHIMYRQAILAHPNFVSGTIILTPHWKEDYVQMVRYLIAGME